MAARLCACGVWGHCTKMAVERDKMSLKKSRYESKTLDKPLSNVSKRVLAQNMPSNFCANKDSCSRNKPCFSSPYDRKALKGNKKGPDKGLLSYAYAKDTVVCGKRKRQ